MNHTLSSTEEFLNEGETREYHVLTTQSKVGISVGVKGIAARRGEIAGMRALSSTYC